MAKELCDFDFSSSEEEEQEKPRRGGSSPSRSVRSGGYSDAGSVASALYGGGKDNSGVNVVNLVPSHLKSFERQLNPLFV